MRRSEVSVRRYFWVSLSPSVPLSHYPYRDSVGQDGTRRPRQYFSRDAPRASAKTMGDVIQKGQPQKVGRKMLRCRGKMIIFAGGNNSTREQRMTTMTVQIPNSQVNWFEQMIRAMGWVFKKEENTDVIEDRPQAFESEVDELLRMFNTDQISQDEVDRECELVKEELYHARQTT